MCFTGVSADAQSGVKVVCEPLDGKLQIRKDENKVLQFTYGALHWKSGDKQCRLLKDWNEFDPMERGDRRRREMECEFECGIDWNKLPTDVLE